MLTIEKGGRALPVGTVREWKGKKFIKTAPGKWRPKYDSHTRGAKLSIAALKRKIASCKDEYEMMQVVLENTSRFRDSRGVLLPIVQQLSQFIKDYQNVKTDSDKKVNPEEEHHNRSLAMMGNQNAKKDGIVEDEDGENKARVKRGKLPNSTRKVRAGRSEGSSGKNVQESELGDNGGTLKELSNQPRIRPQGASLISKRGDGDGRTDARRHKLDLEKRLDKKTAKQIRKACLELLSSKTDDEMTEDDKALLRRYEGAGGLNEKGASTKATLTEFYTPKSVIEKVWGLVDKYIPTTNKKVLEPSCGIGRFAEGREEEFTLCEIDATSSRIARILHPKARVKEGAFQNLFIDNNSVKKEYTGEKYDVVIGNPPYGAYNDFYKGLGEGSHHDRYEQYFIDRGLDALKDGGIMAFVVPSGFLRSGNSKGKEAIAKKGKLLEAFRLPKGTFSSTDVGTDIVIIKKEKGELSDFNNNQYFSENEDRVIGHETDGGNWGTKIVTLPIGKTIEDAIAMIDINASKVEAEVKEAINTIETTNPEEEHRNRSEAMKGNQNAKKDGVKIEEKQKRVKGELFDESIGINMTADEFNRKYNKNIRKEDLEFWEKADWEGVIRLKDEEQQMRIKQNDNFIFDSKKNGFVSVANYASGNIYEKLDELEKEADDEDYARKKKLLLKALPKPKKIGEFFISLLDNFATQRKGGEISLVEKFLQYLHLDDLPNHPALKNIRENRLYQAQVPYTLVDEVVGDTTIADVYNYINRVPVRAKRAPKELKKEAQMEAEKKKQARQETAERMFNKWLTLLSKEERKEIEDKWNRTSNAFVNPDYKAIPLFVEGMNTHKGKDEFTLTEQQVKGVSQLCNKGNGILAYDVGVGKTVTGLIATINQMQQGKAKKPLICVPKAVYKNWLASAKQHFPNVKVNDLGNFGQKDLSAFMKDGKIELPEGAINICTYEALQKITFNEKTISQDLVDDMLESQSQNDYDINGNLLPDERSERERALDREKIHKALGVSVKAKEGAVFFEDLGIDHITVDELHNFKNIFSIPRIRRVSIRSGIEEKEHAANEYQGIQAGANSERGLKLFAMSQLVQKKTNGKGFFGLSATPFNNSPVEIYNILSLTARNRLKELKIFNLQDFMVKFAEVKNDWKVKPSGEIAYEQVMKNFRNLGALQSLIAEYIDKVDGEEAGVIRPYKRVHTPMLDLTPLQKAIINAEIDRMSGGLSKGEDSDGKNDGATLVAMNNMRLATLSPSLIDPKFYKDYEGYEGFYTPNVENVVKESPKLQFVCDTTASQYNKRQKEGQVIYMPRGTDSFKHVKDYLVSKGIPKDAIAFMDSKTSLDKKDAITADFNDPEGKIKVIIGSETIKEGVNLNGNTTTIYNTMLGWNPTETTQVEGRIWRQGNKQGVTHVVYPLMNDSIDAMMYQKYDEKSSRLNALWSYKGDLLNVEDIDAEQLKFDLIKDPAKRAHLKVSKEIASLNSEKKLLNHKIDSLYRLKSSIEGQQTDREYYKTLIKDSIYKREHEKTLKEVEAKLKELFREAKHSGLTSIDDIKRQLKEFETRRNRLVKKEDEIRSKEDKYEKEAREAIEKERKGIIHNSVENMVSHYVEEIGSDLKSFDQVKEGITELRKYSSSQMQALINKVKKEGRATLGGETFTKRDLKDLEHFKSKQLNKAISFALMKLGFLDKAFKEGEHPRDDGGKFTDKGSSNKDNSKWYEKAATVNELLDFAERALNEKTREKLFVGLVNDKTKERIKDITGLDVKSIIVESDALRHSLNKEEHNLGIKDIRHMETVINNADDIQLSHKKHSHNAVIKFSKDINGEITFVEEFRIKRGQLALVTCYRKKKEKPFINAPMLHKSLEANVQNRNDDKACNSINHINKKSRLKKALVEVFNFFTSDEREVL